MRKIIRNFKFIILHLLQIDSQERRVKEVEERRDVFAAVHPEMPKGRARWVLEKSNYVSAPGDLPVTLCPLLFPSLSASVLPLSDFSGLKSQI